MEPSLFGGGFFVLKLNGSVTLVKVLNLDKGIQGYFLKISLKKY